MRLAALRELGIDQRADVLVARGRAACHSACSSCSTRPGSLKAPQIQCERASRLLDLDLAARARPRRSPPRRTAPAARPGTAGTTARRRAARAARPRETRSCRAGRPATLSSGAISGSGAEDRVAQARRLRLDRRRRSRRAADAAAVVVEDVGLAGRDHEADPCRRPPRSMRSTRYSLTARGRSMPSSRRLPTGSSSFEKASGWMRVPLAGGRDDAPHRTASSAQAGRRPAVPPAFERLRSARCARWSAVCSRQRALAGRAARSAAARHRLSSSAAHASAVSAATQDLLRRARRSSSRPCPAVATGSARRRPRPRTAAPTGRSPCAAIAARVTFSVSARGGVEAACSRRRQVADEADVGGPGKVLSGTARRRSRSGRAGSRRAGSMNSRSSAACRSAAKVPR